MAQPVQSNPADPMHSLSSSLRGTVPGRATLFKSATSPDTGLMVLSSSLRILHINGPARSLMALFGEAHELWPYLSPESMPAILIEFCGSLLTELRRQADSQEWAEFEMRRVCHMVTPPLLLRGFGMPAMDGREPRMILTLQPCSSSPDLTMLRSRPPARTTSAADVGRSTH